MYFQRHLRTLILVLVVFLFSELFLYIATLKVVTDNMSLSTWLLAQFIIVIFTLCLAFPFILERYVHFYEDGISYISFFQRKFIRWSDVKEISDVSRNHYPVIQLKSEKSRVKIFLSEYKDQGKLLDFLRTKIPE